MLITPVIQNQGESPRVQPQDESDNSESIDATTAILILYNPSLKVTGGSTYKEESGWEPSDSRQSDDGGLSDPSNETIIRTSQVNSRFLSVS